MDGGMDGGIDGWMEGWREGERDGWMDGGMDVIQEALKHPEGSELIRASPAMLLVNAGKGRRERRRRPGPS